VRPATSRVFHVLTLTMILGSAACDRQTAGKTGNAVSDQSESVTLGRVKLKIPAKLAAEPARGIDSDAAQWTGRGISVLVDQGWFADPLTASERRIGYQARDAVIGGRAASIVVYREQVGTRVIAAHFPGSRNETPAVVPITVVVRLDPGGPDDDVGMAILQSIELGVP